MQDLYIKGESGDFFIPKVAFNATTGICELSGESFLENTFEFYDQIKSWFEDYFKTKRPIFFELRLNYFNTASSKSLLDLFMMLKDYKDEGNEVYVKWFYSAEDEQLLMDIEDFEDVSELSIEKVCIDDL